MIVSTAEVGTMARVHRPAIAFMLVLVAAGCGGTDSPGTTAAAPPATTDPVTVTTQADTAKPAPRPTGSPAFRVRLTGESPQATVGRPWRYIVRATTSSGEPASGTAKMRVFLENELVDTIGFFQFEGVLSKTHRWPAILEGKNVVLQAEVEGPGGTQRVNYPVTIN